MSAFTIEAKKSYSNKVVLVEIDLPISNAFWTTYAAGVYYINMDATYDGAITPTLIDTGLETGLLQYALGINMVSSVRCNGLQLSNVANADLCEGADSSFYFDNTNKNLYVHTPNGNPPSLYYFSIGSALGFRSGGIVSDYNNQYYQDRLFDLTSISKSKDSQFWGVQEFQSYNIKLINSDGFFDSIFEDYKLYNQYVNIKIGFDGWNYSDFISAGQFLISSIEVNEDFINFGLIDARLQFQKVIPEGIFTKDEYPYLADENVGKTKPLAFGTNTSQRMPLICLNEEEPGATEYIFFKCQSLGGTGTDGVIQTNVVYINNGPAYYLGISGGQTLKIPASVYTPGDVVESEFTGIIKDSDEYTPGDLFTNGADIIRKILKYYFGINYNSSFYDLDNWQTDKARDITYYIGEAKPAIDIIGDICANALQMNFGFNDSGKLFLKYFETTDPVKKIIDSSDVISKINVRSNIDKLLTSAVIKYNIKNSDYGEENYLEDFSYRNEVFNTYYTDRQKTFDTYLTNLVNAQAFSDKIFEISQREEKIANVVIGGWYCVDLELGDIVRIKLNRYNAEMFGEVKAEVIGIVKNFNDFNVELTLRIFEFLGIDDMQKNDYYTTVDSELYRKSYFGIANFT